MVSRNATSWVEYGKTQQRGSRAIHSESGMIDVNPGVQKVVLTGLEPGTRYFYRVASREVKLHQAYKVIYGDTLFSDLYSFTTPSSTTEHFSFLAFNDIHSKPEFVSEVVRREKEFNFAMLNGDILGDINSEDDISKYMLIPLSKYFASNKPFFLTRGNHETRGAAARSLGKYIDTPNGKYYYSFNYGNACFIVLDCGEDKPDQNPEYFGLADFDNYRMDEAEWLAMEVQRPEFKNAKYKIVCLHMPITLEPSADNPSGHGMRDCSEKFAPILSNAGVDLLLSGHTHQYSIIKPQKGLTSYPVIVGGAPVSGNNLDKTTYTLVEVDKSGIHCSLKKANGSIIEKVTITK
jgi:predicted MPP superfamily phosphohydrolase